LWFFGGLRQINFIFGFLCIFRGLAVVFNCGNSGNSTDGNNASRNSGNQTTLERAL
jgi:hypothetical protein